MSKRRKRKRKPPRKSLARRLQRPLWALLGLFGLAFAATVLSSRRIHPLEDEDWDNLLDEDLPPGRRSPFPSVSVSVDGPGGALLVDDGGSGGLPVLLVHGLGGSGEQWRAQLEHLRPERRTLAVELRGHGRSEPAIDGDYSIAAYAGDLEAVCDDLGLESFVLAAHSLGALTALEYASRHPDRVAGLLLVDPNGDQSRLPQSEVEAFLKPLRESPGEEMRWYFKQILVGAEPEVAEQVLDDLDALAPEAVVASLEAAASYPAAETLNRYPGPKLSVISDMNSLPYSLHRLLPELPVTLIAGTSHWPMMDRPDDFNRILDGFLGRVRAAG